MNFVAVDNYICPILHNQINLGNNVFHNLLDYGNENIEKLSVDEDKTRNFLLLIDSSIDEKANLRDVWCFWWRESISITHTSEDTLNHNFRIERIK